MKEENIEHKQTSLWNTKLHNKEYKQSVFSQNNSNKLPKNWIICRLDDISKKITDGSHNPPSKKTTGIPMLSAQNIFNDRIVFDNVRYISELDFKKEDARTSIKPGDVLLTIVGTIGRSTVVKDTHKKFAVQRSVAVIKSFVNPYFLSYLLRSPAVNTFLTKNAKGTAQKGIYLRQLKELPIPLPPLNEQKRIVAKIEELFSRLDAGVESLKKVKAQLKRYRQSVLKAAFEGKLTEKWREEHKDELKDAQDIKELINKNTKHQKKKGKDLPLNYSNLHNLPKGWDYVRIADVSLMVQYGTSQKSSKDSSGIPVLRMGNIQDGKLDYKDLKYLPSDWEELNKFLLQDGDVLFNRTNSAELVGKTAVYKKHHPKSVFASYLIRIRVNREYYEPVFLSWYINSVFGRAYINSVVSQQVGQANVNGTKLSLMPIPIMDIREQQKIVEEIERRFSIIDSLEKTIDNSLKEAERLRQAILKKAFEGRLVPQDPNDEPAWKLLERIKEERKRLEAEKKSMKKRTKKG